MKKKHQVPNLFSVEDLSSTTKILSHLKFHYKIPSFPGEQKAFQNHLWTKPERAFPKTEGIQQPDLNLHMTSLQLWKSTASLIINLNCQNSTFRFHLKCFFRITDTQSTHKDFPLPVPASHAPVLHPSTWQPDTIHFSCLAHNNIDSEIKHFICFYS